MQDEFAEDVAQSVMQWPSKEYIIFSSEIVLAFIFIAVTCMMTDWVRSKPWLGLLGNVSASMATLSAFGLCMYIGIDFIGINLAAPFLMIGMILKSHINSNTISDQDKVLQA